MPPHYGIKSFVPLGPQAGLPGAPRTGLRRDMEEAAAFQVWVLGWRSLAFTGEPSLKPPTSEGNCQHSEVEYKDAGKPC